MPIKYTLARTWTRPRKDPSLQKEPARESGVVLSPLLTYVVVWRPVAALC